MAAAEAPAGPEGESRAGVVWPANASDLLMPLAPLTPLNSSSLHSHRRQRAVCSLAEAQPGSLLEPGEPALARCQKTHTPRSRLLPTTQAPAFQPAATRGSGAAGAAASGGGNGMMLNAQQFSQMEDPALVQWFPVSSPPRAGLLAVAHP
jgi:hypothetical protein